MCFIISTFGHPAERVFYALDEDKVCRATALLLLQNAVKFNLREFQEVWQQSVPEGMGTRLDQLRVRRCHWAHSTSGTPGALCVLRQGVKAEASNGLGNGKIVNPFRDIVGLLLCFVSV